MNTVRTNSTTNPIYADCSSDVGRRTPVLAQAQGEDVDSVSFSMGMLALLSTCVLIAAVGIPAVLQAAIHVEQGRWSVPAGSADGKVAIVTVRILCCSWCECGDGCRA